MKRVKNILDCYLAYLAPFQG